MPNVKDEFKGLSVREVRAGIKRYPFAIATYNVRYGINVGAIMRSCNAFAGAQIFIVGSKKWDRRSAIGTQNYEDVVHLENWEALRKHLEASYYTPIGVDYIEGRSESILDIESYPFYPLFIMGNERNGLSPNIIEYCNHIIHIPQFGSVRSLNVAQAASIVMFHWHVKNGS